MNNFFKKHWENFKQYVINNKKNIIFNFVVFLIVVTIFIIIDQVTKSTLFDEKKIGEIKHENALFGIKSVKNSGLTFSSLTNVGLVTFINVIIWIACIMFIFFLRSYWFAIFIGLIFVGSLGNTIDRLAFGYVKDIIYFPWCNKGTFNFADADVIIGSIGIVIILIVYLFKDYIFKKGR